MKLAISTLTANRPFVKALRRQQPSLEELKRRFAKAVLQTCPHEALLLSFVDQSSEWFRVVPGAPEVFEAESGFDGSNAYPSDDDVLLIQMLESRLKRMIESCELHASDRETLVHVVESWTTEMIAQ